MAVCDVMHDLTDGPATFTIRRIELCWRKPAGSSAKLDGSFGNDINRLLAQCRINFERRLKLSNGVTLIHKGRGLLKNSSRRTNEASYYLTAKKRTWCHFPEKH